MTKRIAVLEHGMITGWLRNNHHAPVLGQITVVEMELITNEKEALLPVLATRRSVLASVPPVGMWVTKEGMAGHTSVAKIICSITKHIRNSIQREAIEVGCRSNVM